MIEILGFIFDLLFDVIAAFIFGFDVPDTRVGRILLSIISLAIGILLWAELR
jgi:hypothetical protein